MKKHLTIVQYIFSVLLVVVVITSCKKNDRYLVISKIKSTAKLATTETTIDKVVVGNKERKWMGLVTVGNANFVAYTKATVKTGIDLTKLKPEDVVINDKTITINLPRIQVLDFAYPFSSYKIDEDITENGFLTRMTIRDHEELYRKAELDIRENLRYTGIVEETEKHTTQLMTGLLKNLGYEEIYISYSEEGEFMPMLRLDGSPDDESSDDNKRNKKKKNKEE